MKPQPLKLALLMAAGAAAAFSATVARRKRRMEFEGACVVITGGSRGLGLELARRFGREGARLCLVARDQEVLERAVRDLKGHGCDALAFPCDLTRQEQVEHTVREIVRQRGGIDVLVNNAGIVQVAPFENQDDQDFLESLAIHAWGPLHLIREAVPHLRRRGGGRIVNISSIGGVVAIPHLVPYCVGKFALTALSDGLRAELAKDGIRVTTVIPGLMRTGSHLNASFKGQYRKEYAWFSVSDAAPVFSMSSENAARRILEACRYGRARLVLTLPAALLNACNALLPGLVAAGTRLAARLLPAPETPELNRSYTGRQSRSGLAPSFLTAPADRAAYRNNEI